LPYSEVLKSRLQYADLVDNNSLKLWDNRKLVSLSALCIHVGDSTNPGYWPERFWHSKGTSAERLCQCLQLLKKRGADLQLQGCSGERNALTFTTHLGRRNALAWVMSESINRIYRPMRQYSAWVRSQRKASSVIVDDEFATEMQDESMNLLNRHGSLKLPRLSWRKQLPMEIRVCQQIMKIKSGLISSYILRWIRITRQSVRPVAVQPWVYLGPRQEMR